LEVDVGERLLCIQLLDRLAREDLLFAERGRRRRGCRRRWRRRRRRGRGGRRRRRERRRGGRGRGLLIAGGGRNRGGCEERGALNRERASKRISGRESSCTPRCAHFTDIVFGLSINQQQIQTSVVKKIQSRRWNTCCARPRERKRVTSGSAASAPSSRLSFRLRSRGRRLRRRSSIAAVVPVRTSNGWVVTDAPTASTSAKSDCESAGRRGEPGSPARPSRRRRFQARPSTWSRRSTSSTRWTTGSKRRPSPRCSAC